MYVLTGKTCAFLMIHYNLNVGSQVIEEIQR